MCTTTAVVAADAQSAADALVAIGALVVEPHGRRWLMLPGRRGYTRSSTDGLWWFGDRFHPRSQDLTPVASPHMIAALDAWELSVLAVDTDPTEPHGIRWGHGLVAS